MTSTNITFSNAATQTLSIQELCQEYMQDNPAFLEDQVKAKQTLNDKIIEELRPLCEELPPDALDPVTMEPFTTANIPGVFKCGHVFNKETIQNIILLKEVKRGSGIPCPTCKASIGGNQISESIPLEGLVEHMQKINKIFKEKAGEESSSI